ncbi:hypothetical protein ABZ729_30080 [Streptomyces sp. NPDC006678]|uniref:hypothetical protein n=1 Tax=Streptomyces sp. NPDC006678 TaxID=3157185 RepID=UPI0033EE1369
MRDLHDLHQLARGGVLLFSHALEAGWPERRLSRRLAREGWQRVRPGAWAVPGRTVDWKVRARAVQMMQPRLVCSHDTAAQLHRIELLHAGAPPERIEFIDPRRGTSRRRPGTSVHTMPLTGADWTVRKGLRVTTAARTVGDLIRRGPREDAVVAADSALSRRIVRGVSRPSLLHLDELRAELASARRGAVRAREWLPLTDPASGSPAESVARLRMHDAGLHPESQPTFRSPGGRTIRPDFLFRAQGLVVEIEGYAFHGTRAAHERDARRFNDLADCPEVRRVLRFTAREVFQHPEHMIATILMALARLGGPDALDTLRDLRRGPVT